MQENAIGTSDGTGAVINVCLGWIPDFVRVINTDDETDVPMVEWFRMMSLVTNMDEGILTKTLTDTDRSLLATGGVSAYAGGDELTYDGETNNRWETAAAADATEAYVDGHYRRAATTDAAYRTFGDVIEPNPRNGMKIKTTPGFKIGTNADLNADGQQLHWIAIKAR